LPVLKYLPKVKNKFNPNNPINISPLEGIQPTPDANNGCTANNKDNRKAVYLFKLRNCRK